MAFVTYDPVEHSLESLVSAIFTETPNATLVHGSVIVRHGAPEGEASTLSFYDGAISSLNIGAGLLLTSGDPTPNNKNTTGGTGADAGGLADAPDADLQKTVDDAFDGAGNVEDVTYLQFQINVTDPDLKFLRFDVVIGSDEYPEYSGSSFVDVGGIYVNGVNYALFANDPLKPLSVVKANLNSKWSGAGVNGYFRDNQTGKLPIEYDGVSVKLQVTAPLTLGINTIKIGIADTGDSAYDSGLFVSAMKVSNAGQYGVLQQVYVPDGGLMDINADQSYDGTEGNNLVEFTQAGGGNDIFDGLGGIDTAKFEDPFSAVTFTQTGGSMIIEYGTADKATLVSVERLWFGDGTYLAFDTNEGQTAFVVYAMLNAWNNAAPNMQVLSEWVARAGELQSLGLDYTHLGDEMIAAFDSAGTLQSHIARLYANVVGVAADQATLDLFESLIGPTTTFESIGELFAFAAQHEMNTVEIAGIVGTVLHLDGAAFA